MGLVSWFLGSNEDHYVRPLRQTGRCAMGPTEIVTCEGCGAGNGTRCKCDPDLGRKAKWWET